MKLIPSSINSIALIGVTIIGLGLFVAGLSDVLDYLIIKILLFMGLGILFCIAIVYALKNEIKKNHLEDHNPQDDLY